jgi:hypothetical protein
MLKRIRANARIGTPEFHLEPGDEAVMESALARSFGGNVTVLGDVPVPDPPPIPPVDARTLMPPPHDRMSRPKKTR